MAAYKCTRKIGQNSKQRLIILTVVYSLSSTKPLNLLNDVGLRSLFGLRGRATARRTKAQPVWLQRKRDIKTRTGIDIAREWKLEWRIDMTLVKPWGTVYIPPASWSSTCLADRLLKNVRSMFSQKSVESWSPGVRGVVVRDDKVIDGEKTLLQRFEAPARWTT